MKRTLFFILAALLLSTGAFAQYGDSEISRKHEFGFHAGATTGVGLSYRYWPGKAGIQLTALPIKTEDVTFINVGVTGLCRFYENHYFSFFGYLGSNLTTYDEYFDEYDSYETSDETYKLNVGFGPGFGFGSRVRFNVMAGYGFYDVTGKFNIYPTGEIGLYFRL